MNATINVLRYRLKTLANGENPLMIRVCKGGKMTYKSLGVSENLILKVDIQNFKIANLLYQDGLSVGNPCV